MSFRLKQLNFVVVATCLPAMLLATVGLAQTTSDATNTNSANRTSRLVDTSSGDSHVQSTRNDLIEVIARPIPDDKLSLLLTNVGEADGRLEAQLNELQSSESPREVSLLWLSRVELAVLKSELFAEGSGDGVASAAEAVKIAEAALSALPSGGIARAEVLRLLAEAHLRQGDARSAAAVLRESAGAVVTTSESSSSSESVRALRIRVALSAGDMETANNMLDAVYGSDPTAANVASQWIWFGCAICCYKKTNKQSPIGWKSFANGMESTRKIGRTPSSLKLVCNQEWIPPIRRATDPIRGCGSLMRCTTFGAANPCKQRCTLQKPPSLMRSPPEVLTQR